MARPSRVVAVLVVLVAGWLLAPTSVGGAQSYVTTYGTSMEPGFHAGDLGVLRRADSYPVGAVVGYRSATLNAVVLHRIVARVGSTYTLKGDHNRWLDVDHPTAGDVVGGLVLRVPQGGTWLGRVLSPPGLLAALLALAVLVARSGAGRRRARRRSRRTGWLAALRSPPPEAVLLLRLAALPAMAGAALGLLAWFGPVASGGSGAGVAPPRSMTFSYTATVPASPAFDGTVVTSPDPVFRTLAHLVTVHYAYHGEPGRVRVDLQLSGESGWHSSLPLAPSTAFTENRHDGQVTLDLDALARRAQAAATATGSADEQVTLRVVPRVTRADGASFAPVLAFRMTRRQLTLVDAAALVVGDPAGVAPGQAVPARPRGTGSVSLLGRPLGVDLAQRGALLLLATGIGLIGLATGSAVRSRPPDELTRIRRRYGSLLLETRPVELPADRSAVELTVFAPLVGLAQRSGAPVLHWHQDGVTSFVVRDGPTDYRYQLPVRVRRPRTGASRRDRDAKGRAGSPRRAAERDRCRRLRSLWVKAHWVKAHGVKAHGVAHGVAHAPRLRWR